MSRVKTTSNLEDRTRPVDEFLPRHVGPREEDVHGMLEVLGCADLDQLIDQTVPASIRHREPLELPAPRGEHELIETLRSIALENGVFRSFIGAGYHGTVTPPVILRNVLENPGWYTQYTAYQSEISQGRLEALLNFQTMVADLTALPLANASLLDEATAAAEAMTMCWAADRSKRHRFFVARDCHPQTIAVVRTRAEPRGIHVDVGDLETFDPGDGETFGLLVQYPATDGRIPRLEDSITRAHEHGALVVTATDLLALTLLKPPGELGADVAVGSSQRFGVPMGFGGPHAAFLATREAFKRLIPGRVIGVSRDAAGGPAYRLAMQTREQHIRRDKATSNICTAQALLAVMASMYAVYHGPEGLTRIARRVHGLTRALARALEECGHHVETVEVFDTLRVRPASGVSSVRDAALARGVNLRYFEDGAVGISLDEPTTREELCTLLEIFGSADAPADLDRSLHQDDPGLDPAVLRSSGFLAHEVFRLHHAEHEMLRYLHRLQARDLSLTTSMIPLGSCTMKLNATSEMLPVTWREFADLHPFAPEDQWRGYARLFRDLQAWLGEITGFPAVSLQPNAGASGEYAGLMVIRAYHASRGESHRNVCLIPVSAHGTNPASATMTGLEVVVVACDERGNIDLEDLTAKAAQHRDRLAALMITYPSTHGVFEAGIEEMCRIVHEQGGQVYMDGANMNAQVGLCRPGDMGADVCHLNLHKTFCIPHGGGGPGMGPIAAAEHLAPFLPGHPLMSTGGEKAIGPVAAAPFGSPSILPISWAYIALMGASGLQRASEVAVLNANYMAARLREHYAILYTGEHGRVAHEFVLDVRPFKASAGIDVTDVAKRLMDYGFHAPTMSWPVAGTLMIEPTESESKAELDRFCDAMIAIRREIAAIESGAADREDNLLRNAPHTAVAVSSDTWSHPYSREEAAFPLPWLRERKFWPAVARVDNAYGDRHLVCTCPPVEELAASSPE